MDLKNVVSNYIYSNLLSEIKTEKRCVINTINPHSYCIAKQDNLFSEALISSDVLLPDGYGIVLATKILTGRKIKKIAGADIHKFLLEQADLKSNKVFYLGSSCKTLALIEKKIKKEYPKIKLSKFSPPYKKEFDQSDTKLMIEKVNSFQPDILFVGMTAPKQEKWVFQNKSSLNATVICSVGAVFDFYGGTIKRSGEFWIKLGLEWFPRFLKEPVRLFRRNFISSPKFIVEILTFKVFGKSIL
tara:strand:+ start:4717 stop:5448 length:732 start_codon:yes stop_codon:yes gene_type:complete